MFILKDFQLGEGICDRNINLSFSVKFAEFNEKENVLSFSLDSTDEVEFRGLDFWIEFEWN